MHTHRETDRETESSPSAVKAAGQVSAGVCACMDTSPDAFFKGGKRRLVTERTPQRMIVDEKERGTKRRKEVDMSQGLPEKDEERKLAKEEDFVLLLLLQPSSRPP